jgi:tRNA-Thr(GGU) m(6)t(6)A37 methyltransferase TsaA
MAPAPPDPPPDVRDDAEDDDALRPGEVAVATPAAADAGLWFVGRIATPWARRADCPKRGDPEAGPPCRVEVFAPWDAALDGVAAGDRVEVLYWMHRARRDLARQRPRSAAAPRGTFALRSPVRPNPIASSVVAVLAVEPGALVVRGLDCLDGTPLLDVKPERCRHG